MTVSLSRKYVFFASHRLHSPLLSDEENRATYGKCNNPEGHGHNYEVRLTVRGQVDPVTGRAVSIADLDRLAEEEILGPFRYRDLNREIAAVPTTENLGSEMESRLRTAWPRFFAPGGPQLESISIWETERNICEIAVL